MATIYDADTNELILKAAEELKKMPEIKPPVWAQFAKTGMHKEKPPVSSDWWYIRTASVLRSVYRLGPVGVAKLRTRYGGKKNRGTKQEHFYKGSGNILRKALQQLEKAGFIKFAEKGVHKGRVATPKGKSFLDGIASGIRGISPKQEAIGAVKAEIENKTAEIRHEHKSEAKKEIIEVKQEQKAVMKAEEK